MYARSIPLICGAEGWKISETQRPVCFLLGIFQPATVVNPPELLKDGSEASLEGPVQAVVEDVVVVTKWCREV